MLDSANIVAFAATTDAERTKAFYGGVLGLRLLHEDGFALVFDANGTTLRIARVEKAFPPPYTSLGWQVADVAATVTALAARGVAFERYDGMGQDDLGIWRPPGGGMVAWFKDPEGHLLSISEG